MPDAVTVSSRGDGPRKRPNGRLCPSITCGGGSVQAPGTGVASARSGGNGYVEQAEVIRLVRGSGIRRSFLRSGGVENLRLGRPPARGVSRDFRLPACEVRRLRRAAGLRQGSRFFPWPIVFPRPAVRRATLRLRASFLPAVSPRAGARLGAVSSLGISARLLLRSTGKLLLSVLIGVDPVSAGRS